MSGICESSVRLFDKIAASCAASREQVSADLAVLRAQTNLAFTLQALYRQQVNCGFVLGDPRETLAKNQKQIHDPQTGITFRLKWNPDRELRHDRNLLVRRRIIAEHVDHSRLINHDKLGRPCFLCKSNIDLQNPGEILLDLNLAGEVFYAGANFAYIGDNHFTLMNAEHRPQRYRRQVLSAINDFLRQTDGSFRAIYNGLAGASIEEHEHLQVTTDEFPIEHIRIESRDVTYEAGGLRIIKLDYYLAAWLIQGGDPAAVETSADAIIREWIGLDEQNHTVNVIGTLRDGQYRMFVALRDRRRLAGKGKKGPMGAFETAGDIILSYEPKSDCQTDDNEKWTFDNASLDTVKRLLKDILSPQISLFPRASQV